MCRNCVHSAFRVLCGRLTAVTWVWGDGRRTLSDLPQDQALSTTSQLGYELPSLGSPLSQLHPRHLSAVALRPPGSLFQMDRSTRPAGEADEMGRHLSRLWPCLSLPPPSHCVCPPCPAHLGLIQALGATPGHPCLSGLDTAPGTS